MESKEGQQLEEQINPPEKIVDSKTEQPEVLTEAQRIVPEIIEEEIGERIEDVRTRLQTKQPAEPQAIPPELYGDFLSDKTETGKIVLAPEVQQSAEALALKFRREA